MNPMEDILYGRDPAAYRKITEQARKFTAQYARRLLREEIFGVMINYAEKNGKSLEILRYPVKDVRLCSFTVLENGRIFCVINSRIPLGEQLFSAGHELYRICAYIEQNSRELLERPSLCIKGGEKDREADAFAAAVLAPAPEVMEEIGFYGISPKKLGVRDVVRLMECFGLPYRATALRLGECGILSRTAASALLDRENEALQFIKDSGTAARWLSGTESFISFGTLPVVLRENEAGSWEKRMRLEEIKGKLREEMK